jgi:hypothetical protein
MIVARTRLFIMVGVLLTLPCLFLVGCDGSSDSPVGVWQVDWGELELPDEIPAERRRELQESFREASPRIVLTIRDDGTFTEVVELDDESGVQGEGTWSLSADSMLTLSYEQEEDEPPLVGRFEGNRLAFSMKEHAPGMIENQADELIYVRTD